MTVPILFGVSVAVFMLVHLLPGDPVMLMLRGTGASPEQMDDLRHQLGLDQPLVEQYLHFMERAVRGDFGRSIRTNVVVLREIGNGFPDTLKLTVAGMTVAIVFGFGLGILAALRQRTWLDSSAMIVALFGVAMPNYLIGILLIYLFALKLHWLPATGQGGVDRLLMPAIALGWGYAAIIARLVRANLAEVMRREFVLTARAKGLSGRSVVYRHALKNALIPVVTMLGLQFGNMLSGAVVVEALFARRGIGNLLVHGILDRDFPMVQAIVLILATIYVIVNLVVDLSYGLLDPRIRYG
ncbi:MAG: peptide/nickel transport system permease protein [Thermomicrobiales bacterium]|jgi:ABC-type dipeptide/oligopeptide/nickel transport system permease component|nr:peptide/nickel transport system permease protein [Thermomicrobiales bacterium]MEA2527274.1 peptide/nickel transport system permease protein [Thermomicrobiales bacterium]